MAETVGLLEHRVREVVERLRAIDVERVRLSRELETLRGQAGRLKEQDEGRREVLARAADALEAVARELGEDLAGTGGR